MRVLLQGRGDIWALPAGDTVLAARTGEALRRLGIEADYSPEARPCLDAYDLVHIINLMRVREALSQCRNAVEHGKPVVVTPLYWDPEESFLAQEDGSRLLAWWREDNPLRAEVLRQARLVLVSAPGEGEVLARDFDLGKKFHRVPVGVEGDFARASAEPFISRYGVRDFVLCVGRVLPHKNQLALIQALKGTGLPLVFIGAVNDPFYLARCRKAAGGEAHFLGPLDRQLLGSAYKAARVHALPSWFELPGLTTLEAALAGCNVVTTDRGTARDYLHAEAWYCHPGDEESIRRAVLAAWQGPPYASLPCRLKEFTWQRAAEATAEAYARALGSGKGR